MTTPTPIDAYIKVCRNEDYTDVHHELVIADFIGNITAFEFEDASENIAKLKSDLAAAQEALQFVERWANHHGVKPSCTAEAALSTIQHYPPILAITRSYSDGKAPETRNPWAELEAAQEARQAAEAHEAETHRTLGAILGTDDSLEQCAKRLLERAQAAEARAEAGERDAGRYRWLRDVHAHHYTVTRYIGGATIPRLNGASLDAAIDAAIAGEKK